MTSKGLAGETEIFARYGVTDRLELGFGYLRKQNIVRPLVSYVLVPESRTRPSLTAGVMVDSLEDGRQMVFLTMGKSFPTNLGVPVNIYAGIAQVTTRSETRFVGGILVPLERSLNASVQFDGPVRQLWADGEGRNSWRGSRLFRHRRRKRQPLRSADCYELSSHSQPVMWAD